MQSCVHPFVQNGGCDLGFGNIGVHAERQLDQTDAGLGEESTTTGEPLDEEARQIRRLVESGVDGLLVYPIDGAPNMALLRELWMDEA